MPFVPPVTVAGKFRNDSTAGTTFDVAVLVTAPSVAVTLTGVAVSTGVAMTVNMAIVPPAGTYTDAGTVIAGVVVDKATVTPPAGAGAASNTRFQTGLVPDRIDELANITAESAPDTTAGTTLTVMVRETDPPAAVTCTAAEAVTVAAVNEN
jgi:hypothetical protein